MLDLTDVEESLLPTPLFPLHTKIPLVSPFFPLLTQKQGSIPPENVGAPTFLIFPHIFHTFLALSAVSAAASAKAGDNLLFERGSNFCLNNATGVNVKIYNVTGYLIILAYMLACMYSAPTHLGPWTGMLIGGVYFIFCWFMGGLYLADVLHLGIAHRSLDYKEWFMKAVTAVNNTFAIYVDPIAWVNRHRLHHKHSDHPGDPNKLSEDGFWRTLYLCIMPYQCKENLAGDKILKSRTFRVVANPVFAILAQALSFYLLWKLVGDLKFVLVMWFGIRIFSLWVNMIQNYWTHTRQFGYRRYHDDDDNAMNIGEWLPVTATFSACLQNNHHHYEGLLRLSHDKSEYDFGFITVKVMKYLGLVKATRTGAEVPKDVPLGALDF